MLVAVGTVAGAPLLLRSHLTAAATEVSPAADEARNDLPSIERLLADAERRGRGTVKLPAGRYLLDPGSRRTALTLPANVRIEGAGRDQTILVMAPGARGHVINAPYGWVQIADLTIDGNAARRSGKVGHDLRVEGEKIVIERVRLINSASYGLGIGQRRFARDVVIKDLEIVNAGADGIDLKNRMARTEDISLENILVRGFGRPDPELEPSLIGTRQDKGRGKAAVDLRGKNCVVRGLRVVGLRHGRDGLRFRHGEAGDLNGPGAHGGKASNITVEGNGEGTAIAVISRDVELMDVSISDVAVMLRLAADNTVIERGRLRQASRAAVLAGKTKFSRPAKLLFRSLDFSSPRRLVLNDVERATFDDCQFAACEMPIDESLSRDSRVVLTRCRFDRTCR